MYININTIWALSFFHYGMCISLSHWIYFIDGTGDIIGYINGYNPIIDGIIWKDTMMDVFS
jgi:hypothetical protein